MKHLNAKTIYTISQIEEIEKLISQLEHAPQDKQKGIRNKLRKIGLYWRDFAQGVPYTLTNFREFIKNGIISVKADNSDLQSPSLIQKQDDITTDYIKGLDPIVDDYSKILILGTMPSPDSLRKGEYYANPRNCFWKIISAIFNERKSFINYEEKIQCLQRNHIALWDVFAFCKRDSALDTDIKSEVPNDLNNFLSKHPSIMKVVLNGRKAEDAFNLPFPHKYVGSTSSANAKPLEQKIEEWRSILSK